MSQAIRRVALGLFVFTCFLFEAAVGILVLACAWAIQ
jgi:hypothetical protein